MKKLSIIIVSFNTPELLSNCLDSLNKVKHELDFEVIVVDNNSQDESVAIVKKGYPWVKLIENKENLGFSAGNNTAREFTKGEYILFLNSDTQVYEGTLSKSVRYMDKNKEVGALTVKTVLPSGELDRDARRSFPTPWVAFTHFSHLDRFFPTSKTLAKYWYGHKAKDINRIYEVEVLQGAYFLSRKKILDDIGWFDEDYFLDGEDIDLSYRVKKAGYKIIYFPEVSILHIKKASKKGKRKLKSILAGVNSMQLFYKKHLFQLYPFYINMLVSLGIMFLKLLRTIKYYVLGS